MKRTKNIWGFTFGILLVIISSCSDDKLPVQSNRLRIQVSNEVDILNPALSRLSVSTFVENQMTIPLAKWDDEKMTWIPVLVKNYRPRITNNGVEYSLSIRPEARWSDGKEVKLADLLYTIKMGLNPFISHQAWAAYLDLISDIDVMADSLVLALETPYILADEFIAGLTPYPSHTLDPDDLLSSIPLARFQNGNFTEEQNQKLQQLAQHFNSWGSPENWPKPVCGMFQVHNWIPGQQVTLSRVNQFWGVEVEALASLYDTNIDTVQFVVIPDPQNALHAFTSGVIDVLSSSDDRDSSLLSSFSGRIQEVPTLQMFYVAVNNTQPLLRMASIRRALSMAINRQDIVDRLFQGRGQPAFGPIHPDKPYYDSLVIPFDQEAALQILEDAECQDTDGDGILECPVKGKYMKLSFEIWTTRSQLSRNVATLLKGYWKSIGVNLEIQSADFRSFLPELQNKTFDMATLALRQNNLLDDPYPLWHSSQSDASGKNYQGLANDSIDHVLEELRESVVPEDQVKYYRQFQSLFAAQVPVFFLVAPDEAVGVRDGIDLFWTGQRPGYDLLRSRIIP